MQIHVCLRMRKHTATHVCVYLITFVYINIYVYISCILVMKQNDSCIENDFAEYIILIIIIYIYMYVIEVYTENYIAGYIEENTRRL